jgi:hypothetical protein
MPTDNTPRGMTPAQFARVYRLSPDRVRAMIVNGELEAIDTAPRRCGRRRYVILPAHAARWEQGRRAGPPARPPRRKRTRTTDYFPDL